MVLELCALLIIAVFAGKKLDQWMGLEKPFMVAVCALVALFAFFYLMIKDLTKNQ